MTMASSCLQRRQRDLLREFPHLRRPALHQRDCFRRWEHRMLPVRQRDLKLALRSWSARLREAWSYQWVVHQPELSMLARMRASRE